MRHDRNWKLARNDEVRIVTSRYAAKPSRTSRAMYYGCSTDPQPYQLYATEYGMTVPMFVLYCNHLRSVQSYHSDTLTSLRAYFHARTAGTETVGANGTCTLEWVCERNGTLTPLYHPEQYLPDRTVLPYRADTFETFVSIVVPLIWRHGTVNLFKTRTVKQLHCSVCPGVM